MRKDLAISAMMLVACHHNAHAHTNSAPDPDVYIDFKCPEFQQDEAAAIQDYLAWAGHAHSGWTAEELMTNYIQQLNLKACKATSKTAISSYMPDEFRGDWSSSENPIEGCADDQGSAERIDKDYLIDGDGECRAISTARLSDIDSFRVSMLCKGKSGGFSLRSEYWNKRKFNGADLFVERGADDTYINVSRSCEPHPTEAYDCSKPSTPEETMTCGSPQLYQLATLARKAFSHASKTVVFSQVSDFLMDADTYQKRQHQCGSAPACLGRTYVGEIDAFGKYGSEIEAPASMSALDLVADLPVDGGKVPAGVGDCALTTVRYVTGRLVGDDTFASGTGVGFRNGGYQVSYAKEPAIIGSKVGDPVLICLLSTPKHCPPGDERGKMYLSTDLRTRQSWLLPDAEHSCGGQ